MNNNEHISFEDLNNLLAQALQKEDFETSKRLITEKYPSALCDYYSNKTLSSLFCYLNNNQEQFYEDIYLNILNYHTEKKSKEEKNPFERKPNVSVLIKTQVLLGIIKNRSLRKKHKNHLYKLYCDFVPNEISNLFPIVKKAIYSIGYENGVPKDIDFSDEPELREHIENNKKKSNINYTTASRNTAFNEYQKNTTAINQSIVFYSFQHFIKSVLRGKYLFLKSYISFFLFNAAKEYFTPSLCYELPAKENAPNIFKQNESEDMGYGLESEDSDSTGSCIETHSISNPETESVYSEKQRVLLYSFLLLEKQNKEHQNLLFDYEWEGVFSDEYQKAAECKLEKDEGDNETRDTEDATRCRLRRDLNIYLSVFYYFINLNCKKLIFSNYVNKKEVFKKFFDDFFKRKFQPPDENCFILWHYLARKLISKKQNNVISKKVEFDVLINIYQYRLNKHHNIHSVKRNFPQLIWNESHLNLPDQLIQQIKDNEKIEHILLSIEQIDKEWNEFVLAKEKQCLKISKI